MWLLLVIVLVVEVIGGSRRRESRLGDSGKVEREGDCEGERRGEREEAHGYGASSN